LSEISKCTKERHANTPGRHTGLVVLGASGGGQEKIEMRAFAPATASMRSLSAAAAGSVGAFIRRSQQTERFDSDFLAAQEAVLGRVGLLRLVVSDESIQVGCNVITCIDGTGERQLSWPVDDNYLGRFVT
jgi:predicted PhzF superfamily epimerase YddE/YHI9